MFTPFLIYQLGGRPSRMKWSRMRAAAPVDLGGGSPPAAASSSATPPASPASTSTPASSTGTPAPAASSAAPKDDEIQDGNWKQLREGYQKHKDRAAILDSLGIDSAELPSVIATFTKIRTEASTLAKDLGYDDADFKEAFAADPAQTLALLRSEKSKAATAPPTQRQPGESPADHAQRIKDEVAAQTKPFTEHINRQMTETALAKIGTEFNTAYDAALPNTPTEVRELVNDYVSEYLAGQPSILEGMKTKGDYSAVAETVKFVAGRLQGVFSAWVKSEQARAGTRSTSRTPSPAAPVNGNRRPTLDEMIENPGLIGEAYK